MKKKLAITLGAALAACSLAQPASAVVNLQAYYQFEGNFSNSSGPVGAAAASQNPGQVSFIGGGFRGQSVDINDPAASGGGNTGGSVDIPYNVSPPTNVTFGGWFNLDSNAGFPGAVANDNGGWDRGIHLNGNQWGIASGGNLNNVAPAPTGQWTYVVGTFDKGVNRATLYVGNSVAATQTTASGFRADGATNLGGLAVLEIGRYDNQDLDAKVDDFFIFQDTLNVHQVNAIRNLRLSGLDYTPAQAAQLFNAFDTATPVTIAGTTWVLAAGLSTTNPGAVNNVGSNYTLLLNSSGQGLQTQTLTVPEPATALTLCGALGALVFGRGRRRQA